MYKNANERQDQNKTLRTCGNNNNNCYFDHKHCLFVEIFAREK